METSARPGAAEPTPRAVRCDSRPANQSAAVKSHFELLRFAPVAYLVVDSFGLIMDANHAAAGLFAQRAEELAFRTAVTLIGSHHRLAFSMAFHDVLDSGAAVARGLKTMGGRPVTVVLHRLQEQGVRPVHLLLSFFDASAQEAHELFRVGARTTASEHGAHRTAGPSLGAEHAGAAARDASGSRATWMEHQAAKPHSEHASADDREESYRPLDLIGEALAEFHKLAAAVGVTLQFHPDGSVPLEVLGRPSALRQCLRPLLNNAVRFAVMTVDVVCVFRGGDLILTIEDDGPGIPPADLEHVMLPYVKLFPALSTHAGLGLPRARSEAAALGGTLELASDGRKGTMAMVKIPVEELWSPADDDEPFQEDSNVRSRLPGLPVTLAALPLGFDAALPEDVASEPAAASVSSEAWPASDTRAVPPQLLVATANGELLALLTHVLDRRRVRYEVVADGAAALARLCTHTYAGVVVDITLPTIDGLTVAHWIARAPDLQHVRVLGLSDGALRNEEAACAAAGCHIHQLSGCTLAELICVLDELLSQIAQVPARARATEV